MKNNDFIKKLIFVFPLGIIAIWITSWQFRVMAGRSVTLAIEGYDPRDLLSGHYLRYNVNYGKDVDCSQDGPMYLCLHEGSPHFVVVRQNRNRNQLECTTILQGECGGHRFQAGIERYYFSEEYKRELRLVPRDAFIEIKLSSSGKAVVKELYIDGIEVVDWLEQQRQEVKK